MYCSNCAAPVEPYAVACPHCGVPPHAERRFCTHCAAPITHPKQVMCLQCGARIAANNSNYNVTFLDANALGTGYLDVITKKYALFHGRARRSEYWWFTLINCFVIGLPVMLGFVTMIAAGIMKENGEDVPAMVVGISIILMFIAMIISLALMLPSIALQVRRLHDAGFSGWFWFLGFVPYVGGIIMIVFACLNSQRGDNPYGPNPKGEY